MPEHTFLSYSRHEYYFAESATLSLQHRGLSVWFDLQQIEPGVNWKADIEDGLARSQSLTLVASRASLASPYVAGEWRAALDANKPVYIVLFERVHLPQALRRGAIILDFRLDFEQGVDDLATLLGGGTPPKRRVIPWLPRLPAGVRRMALALAVLDIQILAANMLMLLLLAMTLYPGSIVRLLAEHFLARQGSVALWADNLIAGAAVFFVIRYALNLRDRTRVVSLIRRDFDYLALQNPVHPRLGVPFMLFLLAILGLSDYLWTDPHILRSFGISQPLPGIYTPGLLMALLTAVGAIRIVAPLLVRRLVPRHPDPDIVRWARLGKVPQHMRIAVNRHLLSRTGATLPSDETILQTSATGNAPPVAAPTSLAVGNVATSRTYRIVHAEGDANAVEEIEGIMGGIGYKQAENPAYTLLVLSYRTPLDMVRETMHLSTNVIGVLVTDILLPSDVRALADFQLVDARRNNWPQVRAALRYLESQDEGLRAQYSQNLLPANLSPIGWVPGIANLANQLLVLIGFMLVFVALFFVYMVLSSVSIRPIPEAFVPLAVGCLMLLVIAIALLWCMAGVLRGRMWLLLSITWGIVVLPAVVMLIVELTANPSFEFLRNLDRPLQHPLLILTALYSLVAIHVVRLFAPRQHLLMSSGAAVLGMPSITPGWLMIYVIVCMVVLVTALAALIII